MKSETSSIFLQMVFDELLERVREREEKEAKRRKHVADDFYTSLTTSKVLLDASYIDYQKYKQKVRIVTFA